MIADLNKYKELMETCSHCAFCEATCPVFLEDLLETHLARSRMEIIKASMLDGTLSVTPRVKEIVDRCLLCSNCKQTCPASIPIDEIVISARYRLYEGKRTHAAKRFFMQRIMGKRGVKGLFKRAVSLAGTVGMGPKEMPPLPKKSFDDLYRGTYRPQDKARAKVAYFVGCATNSFYPDTGDAVMKVLLRNGIEVVVPDGLVCCGIPALGEGDIPTAHDMMRKNVALLSKLEVDAIVTDCTSCGLTLKERVLKVIDANDPLRSKAEAVAAKIREVTDFLNTVGLTDKPSDLAGQYTYHVPCHGNWTPTLNEAPRELLARIPQADLVEMENAERCCGAGGTFFMEYEELAGNIRSHKLEAIKETRVDTVVTQCPSCRTYLKAALEKDQTVMHPVSLLAKAYGFDSPVKSR
ncbi:MAG: (Fe-S)-binding protein [Proteobacteria bacterium]|nr:(Fe-S)-binding protein [Pseudomonadota bacterium]